MPKLNLQLGTKKVSVSTDKISFLLYLTANSADFFSDRFIFNAFSVQYRGNKNPSTCFPDMIDVDKIQLRVAAADLQDSLGNQLGSITVGEKLWAWSPLIALLRQAFKGTKLELLVGAQQEIEGKHLRLLVGSAFVCESVEKHQLSHHLILTVTSKEANGRTVCFRIAVIADSFGIAIADIECLIALPLSDLVPISYRCN
jgi:hypothetical protein